MSIQDAKNAVNRSNLLSLAVRRTLRTMIDGIKGYVDDIFGTEMSHADYYFSTPAATTLSAATPAKVAGTTTAVFAEGFTMDANNRLTLDAGARNRDVSIIAAISATKAAGAGATIASFYLYKNGALIPGSTINRTMANTTDEGAIACVGQTTMVPGDYIELWCATVDGDDITVQSGSVSVSTISFA